MITLKYFNKYIDMHIDNTHTHIREFIGMSYRLQFN